MANSNGLTLLGHRKNGRPIYLARGAEDAPPPSPPVPPPAPPAAPPAAPAPPDNGFPANTPLTEMTGEQRENYWKHQSRQHEGRVKALGVTTEELADLRAKAKRADDLDYELASDKDKAVADAKKTARDEADALYRPQIVTARLEAAAAGRIDDDKLATLLGPLDKTFFLAADGSVDTAKVTAYIDSVAPAKGTPAPPRRGPSSNGQGRYDSTPGEKSVASGQDLYAQMHPKKAS